MPKSQSEHQERRVRCQARENVREQSLDWGWFAPDWLKTRHFCSDWVDGLSQGGQGGQGDEGGQGGRGGEGSQGGEGGEGSQGGEGGQGGEDGQGGQGGFPPFPLPLPYPFPPPIFPGLPPVPSLFNLTSV